MNREVYNSFADGKVNIIQNALEIYHGDKKLAERIQGELKDRPQIYFRLENQEEKNMDGIFSLSSLELLRNAFSGREIEALGNYEMNPFFFLLLRYYSDGLPIEYGVLPPLAIIHPYHSERIKVQRGVFTIFPYYYPDQQIMDMQKSLGESPTIAMEYMSQCIPILYKIHIMNPKKVADDLMMIGAKRSNLYPDMQIISQDMENVVK